MEQNKLKLEDCCLTIEQAKELQKLGIDFSNSSLCFDRYDELHIGNAADFKPYPNSMVNTLTNTEMMEMLPKGIYDENGNYHELHIDYEMEWDIYYFGYEIEMSFSANKLRDAIFKMIRRLKINKLM